MRKVTMKTNGDVQMVEVDGKEIACDDGINLNELLYRLSRELGFEYAFEDGDWDDAGDWTPYEG